MLSTTAAGTAAAFSAIALTRNPSAAADDKPVTSAAHAVDLKAASQQIRYCLNTSTLRGQNLGIVKEVELAAAAGYDGIEPWIRELEEYVKGGGSLADLRKQIEDAGLQVESAIGFAQWIVDDPAARKSALEIARRDMDLVKQIGGTHIAAPPTGATNEKMTDLLVVAERYRDLLAVGAEIGVIPQLEVWGFSKTLSRLGETAFVAIECGRADACILPDVYHIYKGGSDFTGLSLIDGAAIHCFHMNDYPADPPRETISDEHRVYPGEGIAPLNQVIQQLLRNGFQGVLSLELFNRTYWQQDAALVARTGIEKMRAAVEQAVST
jgi:2-keto-myo-inositol isomerase